MPSATPSLGDDRSRLCCRVAMSAMVFPGLAGQQRGRAATLPRTSRTRRHTRLKRHQVVPTHQSGSKARRCAPVAQQLANLLFAPVQQRLHDPLGHTWVAVAIRSTRVSRRHFVPGPRHRCPRGRAAHAATRGRSGARWHGSGREAGYRVSPRQALRGLSALFAPGARPLQERLDSAFGHTDRAGDRLRRQGSVRGDLHGQSDQGPLLGRMPEPVVVSVLPGG